MKRIAALGLALACGCQSPDAAGDFAATMPGSEFDGSAFEFQQVLDVLYSSD